MSDITTEAKTQEKQNDLFVINESNSNGQEPKKEIAKNDLVEGGWSSKEIESAEKYGMVKNQEQQKEAEKETEKEVKKEETPKEEPPKELTAEEKLVRDSNAGQRGIAGFDVDQMTHKEKEVFFNTFGPGTQPRALYTGIKRERQAKQSAARERDALKRELETLKSRLDNESQKRVVNDDGEEIDPDEMPLTKKQLKEWEQQKEEKAYQERAELERRAVTVTQAQKDQEDFARSVLPDFDKAAKLAEEVLRNIDATLSSEYEKNKVTHLFRTLQESAANADKYDVEAYNNSAFTIYEIGQLHPDFHKSRGSTGTTIDPIKANGSLTPEKMKRIEENTLKRTSSASVSGDSGRRAISADDVDMETLNRMSTEERRKFRDRYPDNYSKITRA